MVKFEPEPETFPEAEEKDDTNYIAHREKITNADGTPSEILHGPMPVDEWPAYEKEHNL